MNQEQENWTDFVLSKKEIESCRHKSEKRWYWFLCVLNVIIIVGVIACMAALLPEKLEKFKQDVSKYVDEIGTTLDEATDNNKNKKSEEQNKSNKKTEKNKTQGKDGTSLSEEEDDIFDYCLIAIIVIITLPFILNFMYQKYRAMSIRITPKNFPDIYERVELYAKRLGMKKVPEVYIIQQNGILNAFSAFIIRKQYIEIFADIFEIAYREHQDLDSISFVIAHEMAHIHYKHATFGYSFKILLSNMIPILSSTASRAREYSCDRLAQKLTGNDGIEAMFSLMAGKHLYKMVDKEDYLEYAKSVKGIFIWVANLVADHPIMTKRIIALEKGEGSGKLY